MLIRNLLVLIEPARKSDDHNPDATLPELKRTRLNIHTKRRIRTDARIQKNPIEQIRGQVNTHTYTQPSNQATKQTREDTTRLFLDVAN